ncbi:unnamed protein product [Symbiodinium natans]|uniref:Calcineurin-like phosphoesterase domain-containing protein n=1 Tax=Symbiodinium natans TaxID=878477 RepID=A0A812TGV5_9DINO|nr:unnamed protein product [Symbiodinium natans]
MMRLALAWWISCLSSRLAEAKDCSQGYFERPARPKRDPTEHNGQALRDACFDKKASMHVFVIGDWGGVKYSEEMPIMPADHRSTLFPKRHRKFVEGVDDCAQQRVAGQMLNWAIHSPPDYILNVGDNFYWGGADSNCSDNVMDSGFSWHQWEPIYESMYTGPGIDGRQWLGILGNHDYGGFLFTSGWHETIWYTWAAGTTRRWLTPGQFWQVKVHYPSFSIDYYFVDSNIHNAWEPNKTVGHNICSEKYNAKNSSCPLTGPFSLDSCNGWFGALWEVQSRWLDLRLGQSTADWQIVVSHFPPEYNAEYWSKFGRKHGLDLFISGHRHYQQLTLKNETTSTAPRFPFTTIISGGGGGITSDRMPELYGLDDAYGFFDLNLSKSEIHIRAISHGGLVRREARIKPEIPEEAVHMV